MAYDTKSSAKNGIESVQKVAPDATVVHQRRRRPVALGRLTPIEFEAIMTTPASQAA